jgi:membrane protease YdiL (CAAX protease family)
LKLRNYLIFLPSTVFGLLGAVWLWFHPLPYEKRFGLVGMLVLASFLVALLLGSAWLLERTLPSFRNASKLLERALGNFHISLPFAFALAALSSVAEELFFRGALMPLINVWGQALVFGLLHPAPRKAWSYTVFTGVAGLIFGLATLYSGSLLPAIVAHFVINLQGFLELRQKNKKRHQRLEPFLPKASVKTLTEKPLGNTLTVQDLSENDINKDANKELKVDHEPN